MFRISINFRLQIYSSSQKLEKNISHKSLVYQDGNISIHDFHQ